MEKRTFDLSLVRKIQLITIKNPDTKPFEWFVVGFLFAHPNNSLPLEDVFANVNSVVMLSRTSPLTQDDINDILIKMINNLMSSQAPHYSQKRSELSSTDYERRQYDSRQNMHIEEDSRDSLKKRHKLLLDEDSGNSIISPLDSSMFTVKEKEREREKEKEKDKIKEKEKEKEKEKSKAKSIPVKPASMLDNSDSDDFEGIGLSKPVNNIKVNKPIVEDNKTKSIVNNAKATYNSEGGFAKVSDNLKIAQAPKELNFYRETKENSNTTSFRNKDLMADDFSYDSDNNDLESLKQKTYSRESKPKEVPKKSQAKPSTLSTHETMESPLRTDNFAALVKKSPAVNNTKAPEPNISKKKDLLEDFDDSDENLLAPPKPKESRANSQERKPDKKLSDKLEEQEVDYRLTSSAMAMLIQKKSVTKNNPPVNEKKQAEERKTDPFSDSEEEKSLILKKSENPKKPSQETKKFDAMEEEFDGIGSFANSSKRSVTKKVKIEEDDDDWEGVTPSNVIDIKPTKNQRHKIGSIHDLLNASKKQKAVQLGNLDDVIIDVDDFSSPEENSSNIANLSKFKKQKVSQTMESTEQIGKSDPISKPDPILFPESQSQGMMFTKKHRATQLVDKVDLVEIDSQEDEPAPRKPVVVKKVKAEDSDEDFLGEKVTYVKKPVDQVVIEAPKASKELKRGSTEGEEKLSLREIKELHAKEQKEPAKRGRGASKAEKEAPVKGTKKKK